MRLNERIKVAMDAKGYRPIDLARAAGMSKQKVSQILNGDTENPRMDTLIALANALDVDYNYIFGWDDTNA